MKPEEIMKIIENSEQYTTYMKLRQRIAESNNAPSEIDDKVYQLKAILDSIKVNGAQLEFIGNGDYRIVYKYDNYIIKFPIGSTIETDMELELIKQLNHKKLDILLEHIIRIYYTNKDKVLVEESATVNELGEEELVYLKTLFIKHDILLPDIYYNQIGKVNGVIKVYDFGIWRNIDKKSKNDTFMY